MEGFDVVKSLKSVCRKTCYNSFMIIGASKIICGVLHDEIGDLDPEVFEVRKL